MYHMLHSLGRALAAHVFGIVVCMALCSALFVLAAEAGDVDKAADTQAIEPQDLDGTLTALLRQRISAAALRR